MEQTWVNVVVKRSVSAAVIVELCSSDMVEKGNSVVLFPPCQHNMLGCHTASVQLLRGGRGQLVHRFQRCSKACNGQLGSNSAGFFCVSLLSFFSF